MSWEIGDGYYAGVKSALDRLQERWPILPIAEIGRSIVKHAGRLYCRVMLVKQREGHDEVFLDTGLPGGVSHGPTFVRLLSSQRGKTNCDERRYKFYGNTCCHTCLFTADLKFRPIQDDILELGGMGAYTVCKMSSFHGMAATPVVYRDDLADTSGESDWPTLATSEWEILSVLAVD